MTQAPEIPAFLDRRTEYQFHPVADIFPLLEGEAFEALVEDIRRNGLLEPIWLHQDARILDGRNRYRACNEASVEPRFQHYIGNDDNIVAFVVSLNLHRRHLNESQRAMVAARLSGMKQGTRTDLAPIGAMSQPEAAEQLGVSRRTVQRAKRVLDSGCEALVQAVDQGDVPLADAAGVVDLSQGEQESLLEQVQDGTFKKLKNAKHKAEIDKQRAQIELGDVVMPEGVFEVIVIDPPWKYDEEYDAEFRRAPGEYPSMSDEELLALELPAAEDCVLWLWFTNAMILRVPLLLDAWGFQVRTILTWKKPGMGTGRWLRNCTEHCLLATKGAPRVDLKGQTTWLEAPRRENGRKPDEFYELVEGLCVGRRLDYFSREKRKGWAQAGNEPEKFGGGHE